MKEMQRLMRERTRERERVEREFSCSAVKPMDRTGFGLDWTMVWISPMPVDWIPPYYSVDFRDFMNGPLGSVLRGPFIQCTAKKWSEYSHNWRKMW